MVCICVGFNNQIFFDVRTDKRKVEETVFQMSITGHLCRTHRSKNNTQVLNTQQEPLHALLGDQKQTKQATTTPTNT